MAPGPVTAAVACLSGSITGSAAAGVAEFLGGRACIPVAGRTRDLFVLLTAGACVQSGGFLCLAGFHGITGFWLCLFWHSFTNRTVIVR